MTTRNYWLDLFTGTTWQEFLNAGSEISGFRERRWNMVQQIKSGDYMLCYLTGVSRWIGVLEVVAEPFRDSSPRWETDAFPCRVHVKMVASLTPESAVPVLTLRDQLSIFQNLSSPNAWTGHFRGSPAKINTSDGEVIVNAILNARENPTIRQIDARKLARKPPLLKTKLGTLPAPEGIARQDSTEESRKDSTLHTETQWLLLKLGSDMGLDVWVAQNDRNRGVNGHNFTDLPRLKRELPLQFDDFTNLIIRLIDVLWLRGNTIVAAFEIECTTSIYSGLLRMSDLIAMQPNLNIPLYIVAPKDREEKVRNEMNRPTFKRLSPPMPRICRFISISALHEKITQIGDMASYTKPEFLGALSKSCEIEDV